MTEDQIKIGASQPKSFKQIALDFLQVLKGWQAIPAAVIAVYIFAGVFGPLIAPFDPHETEPLDQYCPPLASGAKIIDPNYPFREAECNWTNILGTDGRDRDIFSRLLFGARQSLSLVGFSTLMGVILGTCLSIAVTRLRPKLQLAAYAIVVCTVVPFAFFSVSHPYGLARFGVLTDISGLLSFFSEFVRLIPLASISMLISMSVLVTAYRLDPRCREEHKDVSATRNSGKSTIAWTFDRLGVLAPWILLATISGAALTYSVATDATDWVSDPSAITWVGDQEHRLLHIGMWSPHITVIAVFMSLVALSAWWARWCLLKSREPDPAPSNPLIRSENPGSVGIASGNSSRSSDEPGQSPQPSSRPKLLATVSRLSLRYRLLPIALLAAAILLIAARLLSEGGSGIIRDTNGYNFIPETQKYVYIGNSSTLENGLVSPKLTDCLSGRNSVPFAEEHEPSLDRGCLDAYQEFRNSPSHRLSLFYIWSVAKLSVVLVLLGSVAGVSMAYLSNAYSLPSRILINSVVAVLAVIGVTLAVGVTRTVGFFSVASISQALGVDVVLLDFLHGARTPIIRDASIAISLSYICASTAISRFGSPSLDTTIPMFARWIPIWLAAMGLTSGVIMSFNYPFPSILLFYDHALASIVGLPQNPESVPPTDLLRHWLWTYWFAILAYAAIVFGAFAVAIWGFRRYGANVTKQEATTVSANV